MSVPRRRRRCSSASEPLPPSALGRSSYSAAARRRSKVVRSLRRAERASPTPSKPAQGTERTPLPPELAAQFLALQKERVSAPFDKDLAALNTSYRGGLERAMAEEKKAGRLDSILALEAEQKLVASTGSRSSGAGGLRLPIEATAMPVAEEDEEKTPKALKDLRGIYRASFALRLDRRWRRSRSLADRADLHQQPRHESRRPHPWRHVPLPGPRRRRLHRLLRLE